MWQQRLACHHTSSEGMLLVASSVTTSRPGADSALPAGHGL